MSSYTIYVLEMQAEIQRLGSELAEARREIQSLIESIWRAEYRREAPQWKPLPDLVGMITQMDNMYAGVREQRDQARWDKVEARDKALDEAAEAVCGYIHPAYGELPGEPFASAAIRALKSRKGTGDE